MAVPWSDRAAELLAGACRISSVEDYRRQVDSEEAVLFEIASGGEVIGFYLLRVDHYAEKIIGVIVAAAAVPGFALVDTLMPAIERQFIGCDEIIQYCARPGMVRKMIPAGWEPTHIVIRKVLKHG